MTYLHQIKQYFTTRKTTAQDHGDDDDVTLATIVEAERSLRLNTETLIKDFENNDFTKVKNRESDIKTNSSTNSKPDCSESDKTDTSRNDKTDTLKSDKIDTSEGVRTDISAGNLPKVEYEANPGYNPFDEDEPITEDDINIGFTEESLEDNDVKTINGDKVDPKGEKQNGNNIQESSNVKTKKLDVNSSQTVDSNERKNCLENNDQAKVQDSPEKLSKLPPSEREETEKGPWKLANNDVLRDKERTKDTAPNKPEQLGVTGYNSSQETVLYSAKPGYNPFLDEETEETKADDSQKRKTNLKSENTREAKSRTSELQKPKSLNPFDDDYIDDDIDDHVTDTNTVQTVKPKSLNPFDDDYEEPFETDLDEVPSEHNAAKSGETTRTGIGIHGESKGLGSGSDKRVGMTNIDDVIVGKTSPRKNANKLQASMDNGLDSNVSTDHGSSRNDTSQITSGTRPETTEGGNAMAVRSVENVQVTPMHRKEERRPGERPAALVTKVCTSLFVAFTKGFSCCIEWGQPHMYRQL